MERQCQLAEVSRAGFYRYLQQTAPEQADLLLRARLQELALAHHRLRGIHVSWRFPLFNLHIYTEPGHAKILTWEVNIPSPTSEVHITSDVDGLII